MLLAGSLSSKVPGVGMVQAAVFDAVLAVQAYIDALLKKNREEPDGNEMNDHFVATSILDVLMRAGNSKDSESNSSAP